MAPIQISKYNQLQIYDHCNFSCSQLVVKLEFFNIVVYLLITFDFAEGFYAGNYHFKKCFKWEIGPNFVMDRFMYMYSCTGCLENNFHILFLNNSAKIKTIPLKFNLFVVRLRRFCLKKELLNLVIWLPRYGSAKTTPGFFETRAWTRPHDDIPEGVPP